MKKYLINSKNQCVFCTAAENEDDALRAFAEKLGVTLAHARNEVKEMHVLESGKARAVLKNSNAKETPKKDPVSGDAK